jgi:hypothetical protein
MIRVIGGLVLGGVFGCGGPLEANGSSGGSFSIEAGQELELTLGTTGPGEYGSPPDISSPALRFLDVRVVGPFTPGGARQRFRFKGMAPGVAVIVFHNAVQDRTVEDTVNVH